MSQGLAVLVATLATWRLCHLVASEDGPADIIVRLRRLAGSGQWGRAMDCPYCLSLWFAVPFAAWIASGWSDAIVLWLGISGGACLIEQAAARLRERGDPPVTIVPMPPDT